MSAGSDASNIGYGNIAPFSNINGKFVNVDNSHNPATFSSNEIPGLPGLSGAKSNIDAAAGYVPGICFKGGAKKLKRKIKNITKKYKMKNKKSLKNIKKSLKKKYGNKINLNASSNKNNMTSPQNINRMLAIARIGGGNGTNQVKKISSPENINRMLAIARIGGGYRKSQGKHKSRKMRYTKKQRGGYGQYQNNLPMTPTYSVGGQVNSSNLGLANPPPINVLSNCTNCVDNYNHFTNKGFPSTGH